jgi:type VI secretion system protein ImpJ
MTKAEKVVWTEGMFLRPHHFQRTESYLLNHVREWGALQRSYLWGFLDVELDEAMLRQGCIALSYCSGLLPDGTFFQVRNGRNGPVPLKIPDNLTNEKVVLALPVRRGEREEVIFSEEQASLARFIAFEQEVEDDNAMSVGDATVQFGRLRLTLMLEKDLTAEWTAIGVAFVTEKRNDNHVRLDSYIPPMLNANNNPLLYSMINDLHGLLVQRSQQIGGRLRQPGRFNTSELIEFTLLSLVNRHLGEVSHLKTLPLLHPEALWHRWLPFATELATWTSQRSAESVLPIYDHDDLAGCFSKLMLMLRQGLSLVMEDHAIQLPLNERSHGLNIATVPETSMVREFGFVLAVKANVPGDHLQTHFPAQMKVAPVSRIRDLVQLQLPGIMLRAMPVAPPQSRGMRVTAILSWRRAVNCGTRWTSPVLSLCILQEFPGLDMEFWAIRSPTE